MIRQVTLYKVQSERVHEVSGEHVYMRSLADTPIRRTYGEPPNDTFLVTTERLPIHKIYDSFRGRAIFIALDPALKEILEVPIRAEAQATKEELEYRNRCLRDELRNLRARLGFNRMPLHKKLWFILKGGKV